MARTRTRSRPLAEPALLATDREARGDPREPVLGLPPSAPDPGGPLRPARRSRRQRLAGPAGSLGLHLAVVIALLFSWQRPAPVEHPPIPVQIVFEPPPKPEPPPRRAEKPPPRGPIASENFGDIDKKDLGPVNHDDLTPGGALLPLDAPKPSAPALPKPALVPPAPAPVETAALRPPQKPRPPRRPARRLTHPGRMTMRLAKYPGPAATKSDYMAYLVALVRQHSDLLPPSLIMRREGETVVGVLVRDNGTIAMMQINKSSGYPDIDRRVEAMITAVGRFPPLPQWFQGPAMPVEFVLRFPGGVVFQ